VNSKRQTGYLVLADISGYTGFQATTELDHAQLAISYLLETIVEHLGSVLAIVELEGDAVFAYIEDNHRPSDATLLGLLEQTYHAFRDKSLSLHKGTTCKCRACAALTMLDLKFMVHYGEFIVQQLAGRQSLFGTDVTLVHRLMKNNVAETMGWRGYALFTRQGIENCKGDKTAFVQRRVVYEHIGEVEIYVANLGARYASMKAA
jgi:hypothetical protein